MPSALLNHAARAAALVGCAVALTACGGADEPDAVALTAAEVETSLASPAAGLSPAERRLERAAGTVLPGDGAGAGRQLERLIDELDGTPVVVNLWADTCEACKKELPLFQRAALAGRGKVVVLGSATLSTRGHSEDYLETIALPFPSLLDNDGDLFAGTGVSVLPKTLFYDADGEQVYVKQGPYRTLEDLQADIDHYAAPAPPA